MIIAIVVDSYNDRSNGTSMSAFRFARELVKRGHEVRVVATFPRNYGDSKKNTESKNTQHNTQDPINIKNIESNTTNFNNLHNLDSKENTESKSQNLTPDSKISHNLDSKIDSKNSKRTESKNADFNIQDSKNLRNLDSTNQNIESTFQDSNIQHKNADLKNQNIESNSKDSINIENTESKNADSKENTESKSQDFTLGACGEKIYYVKERYIPIVSEVSRRQHMIFGYPDKKVLRRALQGCDIAHFYLPFALEIAGIKLCRQMQIPYIAAFHLQPEHISYNMGMNFAPFNRYLFGRFRRAIYRYCHHIHCPSALMQSEIERENYGGKKFVISNGFSLQSLPNARASGDSELFNIISVGRFSKEKRHKILIQAINKSKHASRIKLHLHGSGPLESNLRSMCETLKNKAEFGFIDNALLLSKMRSMQLYVHPAEVESEAISCLEAVSSGVVPLIADSKVSATRQFALDSRSLFRVNDAQDLADKIDFWIENPHALEQMHAQYATSASKYDLQKSIDSILSVYNEAIQDFKDNPNLFRTFAS